MPTHYHYSHYYFVFRYTCRRFEVEILNVDWIGLMHDDDDLVVVVVACAVG